MRILLLGGSGQVGTEFKSLANPESVFVHAPDRATLDLDSGYAVERTVAEGSWDAVINAAAFTNVDLAESQEAPALAINGAAATRLAAETARRNIPLIHISSDYVFDGRKGAPYVETDSTAPLNAYGRSKLAGEAGVRAANPKHVILRSSWVFSPFRTNFLRTILRLAAERERLTIIADQRGCPTAAQDLAKACLTLALECTSKTDSFAYGTYHFAGSGEATWFEFASTIIEIAGDRLSRKPEVVPIGTVDYPTPAQRPADSRLDCSKIIRTFGIKPSPWRSAVGETLERILT